MAEEKKGFLLYSDIIHTIEKLTDEQAGVLFKHILKYVNDLNPTCEDLITEIVFEPIKQKEEEKAKIRAENKSALDKLTADKNAEIERLKKEAEDKLAIAKEAQKQEYIGYMVKALVGVGILFLIAAGLMKSINMGIVSISSFALAYTIATAPVWVIGTVVGITVLSMVGVTIYSKMKQKAPVAAPVTIEAAPAPVRQAPRRRSKKAP